MGEFATKLVWKGLGVEASFLCTGLVIKKEDVYYKNLKVKFQHLIHINLKIINMVALLKFSKHRIISHY
jgi:hypothetical protein